MHSGIHQRILRGTLLCFPASNRSFLFELPPFFFAASFAYVGRGGCFFPLSMPPHFSLSTYFTNSLQPTSSFFFERTTHFCTTLNAPFPSRTVHRPPAPPPAPPPKPVASVESGVYPNLFDLHARLCVEGDVPCCTTCQTLCSTSHPCGITSQTHTRSHRQPLQHRTRSTRHSGRRPTALSVLIFPSFHTLAGIIRKMCCIARFFSVSDRDALSFWRLIFSSTGSPQFFLPHGRFSLLSHASPPLGRRPFGFAARRNLGRSGVHHSRSCRILHVAKHDSEPRRGPQRRLSASPSPRRRDWWWYCGHIRRMAPRAC